MNYEEKLKVKRFRKSTIEGRTFNEEMESDRGRSINSAAVRRLQQKTQVFPLEANTAVRSRLTHSLEVQQVGRYISKLVLKKLKERGNSVLNEYSEGFVSAVEVACLLHDIGTPPFGHFGEEAIKLWTKRVIRKRFSELYENDKNYENDELAQKLVKDLCNFESNAQGIRLLHRIQNLNLTYTQLACLIKYTCPAYEDKPDSSGHIKKKPGYYFSEEDLCKNIREELSIEEGFRFPLTYIVEAADDISYCIADIEDAVDKGILSIEELQSKIKEIWEKECGGLGDNKKYLTEISEKAKKKADKETREFNRSHAYTLTLRTELIKDLSECAASRYLDNHEKVFHGELDESLLDGRCEYNLAMNTLKSLAVDNVFNHSEVENLELKGYAVICGLLDIYFPLIELSSDDFEKLTENKLEGKPLETRLYHKLPNKHKAAYSESVDKLKDKKDKEIHELYYRSRLLIDYISGMTDGFALEEYQNLKASM